jgi:ribonuclease HI
MLPFFLITNAWQWGQFFATRNGSCIVAASEPMAGLTSPELAEALALRRAMEIARERGHDKIIFASDCLSLIQRISSARPDRSPVGSVVLDIKELAMGFSSVAFRHVNRSLNEAAHVLARTCDVNSKGFISSLAPDCIRKTLCIDVM